MEAKDLYKSKVRFHETAHMYLLPEGELSGITTMLKAYVFPDLYKGVPKRNLDAAKAKGSDIHGQVQMIVDGFGHNNPDLAVVDLFKWTEANGIRFIASEHLVDYYPIAFKWTDKEKTEPYVGYASAIDIIDSDLNLYDIKTTAKFEKEYVRWQLSVYAYLFERNNPTKKAGDLYCVWLRDGKARVIRVERISSEIIEDLLRAYADGLPWSNPLVKNVMVADKKQIAKLTELQNAIKFFDAQKKEAERQEKELKEGLLKIMLTTQTKTWISPDGSLTLTIRNGYPKESLDTEGLRRDHPELVESYTKITEVKPTLLIKVKDNTTPKLSYATSR